MNRSEFFRCIMDNPDEYFHRKEVRVWDKCEKRMHYDSLDLSGIAMYYIGINDDRNRKIYEGDFIRVENIADNRTVCEGVVVWNWRGEYVILCKDGSEESLWEFTFSAYRIEVLGNIFEGIHDKNSD